VFRASSYTSHPLALLASALLAFPVGGLAVTLDWDQPYGTWTAGAPAPGQTFSQSYDTDPAHAGNDVAITLANSASNPAGFSWYTSPTNYPTVNSSTGPGSTGGLSPVQNALQLAVVDNNPAGVTLTINFYYPSGVQNLNFTLFDVDRAAGTFQDQIFQILATPIGGGPQVGPASVTGSSSNAVSGSGTSYVVNGTAGSADASSNGNVFIDFGATAVASVSFTWRNTDPALATQWISLHDINYSPLPEVGSGLAALVVCAVAMCRRVVRRRRGDAVSATIESRP
jgi:hypothetical protein